MEYQERINLIDRAANQVRKYWTKTWLETNHNTKTESYELFIKTNLKLQC